FGADTSRRWPAGSSDLLLRMQLFAEAERRRFDATLCRSLALDPRSVRAVERTRRQLRRILEHRDDAPPAGEETLLRCTLVGFPDRVVRRRAPGSPRGVMVGGTGVVLGDGSVVRDAELFVAVEVDAGPQR